jgi:hypothetical protein
MELKTTLNKEMTRRYRTVKKDAGMNDDKNVLALLISKQYSRIQKSKYHKVFLPKETYDLLEKAARTRGQTLDEYIEELTEAMVKDAKEGVENGKQN